MGTRYGMVALIKLVHLVTNAGLMQAKELVSAFLVQYIGETYASLGQTYLLTDRDLIVMLKFAGIVINNTRGWVLQDGKVVISRPVNSTDIGELVTIE